MFPFCTSVDFDVPSIDQIIVILEAKFFNEFFLGWFEFYHFTLQNGNELRSFIYGFDFFKAHSANGKNIIKSDVKKSDTCLYKYSPLNDVTHLGGRGSVKSLFSLSKMGDKREGSKIFKNGWHLYGRPLNWISKWNIIYCIKIYSEFHFFFRFRL